MSDYRKYLIDQFENFITDEYRQYCFRHETPETIGGIITFIVDRDLIPNINIKKFTILREFGPVYERNDHHKTNTVEILADRYNLSKRTIWSILKHHTPSTKRWNSFEKNIEK